MSLTAIDLFSGMGGLTQGLRDARFRVLGAVEKLPLAVETYQANHLRTTVWNCDIADVEPMDLARDLGFSPGTLDLLAGCPPCQGFSSLRTRNGRREVDDGRNDLVFEFARFARVLRPRTLMMENVPGLAADSRLTRLVNELGELGYVVRTALLDAADYGVPQRRRRLILVGARGRAPELGRQTRRRATVRTAISALPEPGLSGDPLHDLPEMRSERVMSMIRRIPKDGGSRSDLGSDAQLRCHRRFDGFHDVYGRMAWDAPSPTITGGCINPSKGRFLHPAQNRAVTLREASLLQSFPPNYKISLSEGKYAAADLIGNALPPVFVRRHARALARQLK